VEPVPGVDDAALAGRAAGELEGGLDRLGAAVAEEDALQPGGLGQQLLRQQAHDRLAVELGPGGEVHLQRVLQGLLDHRVAAARGEHPEPGQEVGVGVPRRVVQVRALTPHVVLVEADRAQRARQLRVQVLRVQLIALAAHGGQFGGEIKAHVTILSGMRGSSPRSCTRSSSGVAGSPPAYRYSALYGAAVNTDLR
jgi:hypothetical protein